MIRTYVGPYGTRIIILIIGLCLLQIVSPNRDLNPCCGEGRRLFVRERSCQSYAQSQQSRGHSCQRTSGICCLRSLFESKCADGETKAKAEHSCASTQMDILGGGFEKECCECCILAKELVQEGKPCKALQSFSNLCRKSFERCCQSGNGNKSDNGDNLDEHGNGDYAYTYASGQTVSGQGSRNNVNNRCWGDNPCQQLCEDHGEADVRCACRPGYQLNSDKKTCADINECEDPPSTSCDLGLERCVNTEGSYECMPLSHCPMGMTYENNHCIDVDECRDPEIACDIKTEDCINTYGSFECRCKGGFTFNITQSRCVDLDECMLGRDTTCLVGQRCVNTFGSYKCIRTMSCGTGYYLDSETEECKDIDECALATHNCGTAYSCRNTQGSFRCERRVCPQGQVTDRRTGQCVAVTCDPGFIPGSDGRCKDIDECGNPSVCRPFEMCVNNPGSFECQEQRNYCGEGYEIDRTTGQCNDVDECARGTHRCNGDQNCRNLEGGYKCDCPTGYNFNQRTKQCDDVDECTRFGGHVCSFQASCENTPGSFRCNCNEGYVLASDERTCEDVDECQTGRARCQQRCVNVPGSYQCICDRGFTVGVDGVTCQDIDECSLWGTQGASLCMGRCVNTPGSYTCECPSGYQSSNDGRTCDDIDECSLAHCQGEDRICVNTLGSFKCHTIQCPENYFRDSQFKNLVEDGYFCKKQCQTSDVRCVANHTMSISFQFASLPSLPNLPDPVEVTRVRAESVDGMPFYVKYVIDRANAESFFVEQQERVGVDLHIHFDYVGQAVSRIYVNAVPVNVSNAFDAVKLVVKTKSPTTLVEKGSSIELECSATGRPVVNTIHWQFQGKRVTNGQPEEDGVVVEKSGEIAYNLGMTTSKLFIPCVTESEAGSYECVANNSLTTERATITVQIKANSNDIVYNGCSTINSNDLQPAKIYLWTESRIEKPGSTVNLICRSSGYPKPKTIWYEMEANFKTTVLRTIENSETFQILPNGDLLTKIPTNPTTGATVFRCVVSNLLGEDFVNILLVWPSDN